MLARSVHAIRSTGRGRRAPATSLREPSAGLRARLVDTRSGRGPGVHREPGGCDTSDDFTQKFGAPVEGEEQNPVAISGEGTRFERVIVGFLDLYRVLAQDGSLEAGRPALAADSTRLMDHPREDGERLLEGRVEMGRSRRILRHHRRHLAITGEWQSQLPLPQVVMRS